VNKTMQSDSYKAALHQSKLIPLGKRTPEKKEAVHKLIHLIKVMLKENS
jgi:hypothetical protein